MADLDQAMEAWFRARRLPAAQFLARRVTRRAGRIAGVSLVNPRPVEAARQVRCPVLVMHGSDDTLITVGAARQLAAAFPGRTSFIEVPGAKHSDVVAVGGEALLEQVIAFLESVAAK